MSSLPPPPKIRIPLHSALHCSVVFCLQAEKTMGSSRNYACRQLAAKLHKFKFTTDHHNHAQWPSSRLGRTNPYIGFLEARVEASSNKERVYGLVRPNPLITVGVNQPVYWFLGGKGRGIIQQGTSVWIGSPKSPHHG